MARHLVIVESPAKAKTINKYLGREYVVKSSFGHIRDLPTGGEAEADPADRLKAAREAKAKAAKAGPAAKAKLVEDKEEKKWTALVRRMGVDPEHGWLARYEISPGKEKVVAELRAAAATAETIWLASDLDREGEAISWHLQEVLGGEAARFRRVTFNEITKSAITQAFLKPGSVNMDRVNAQQARRFLDRVVGFQVSPLLWSKVARGLSAGRVQSVAVRLIVDREREINAFKPDEYWEIHCDLASPQPLRALVVREDAKPFKPVNRSQADTATAALKTAAYKVISRDDKPAKAYPTAPYITSTLQAAASTRLSFSVKKTMTLAQRLYEAGHITYMRTDSVNLSADAVTACRALIESRFGPKYLPAQPIRYASKDGAQEAHEAIRPTDAAIEGRTLDLEPDAQRLYELIWRQFVACQMPPAEFDTTTVTIAAGRFELTAKGRVLRFDGFYKVQPPAKTDDQVLPALTAGQTLKLVKVDPTQHFTKPPPRYSEAGLVKELEKRGIGRPSTYASIISTIQERGYVKVEARRFFAEKLGEIVTDRLVAAFPDLLDFGFTAGMERELDVVAEGKEDWKRTLDRFYGGFKQRLSAADQTMPSVALTETPIACPTCGRPMAIRTGRTGVFLSCTGYSLPPKERCTATINLIAGDEIEAVSAKTVESDEDESTEADALRLHDRRRCPICGTAMDAFLVDAGRKLHVCHRQPECKGLAIETGVFRIKGYEGPSIPCDKCGLPMQLKTGRFGKYFGCTGYPGCDNTRKLLRNGQAAPPKAKAVPFPELICPKGGHYVFRDGAAGVFLASSDYPKVRDARNPLVRELKPHRDELDDKFHYLCDGPSTDPDGNPVVIRYSKKTTQQYLASEKDGKPTGWARWWKDGAWIEQAAVAKT